MLAERLKLARMASGMSLRELAAQSGVVTAAAISKYEMGHDQPRQSVVVALARALNIQAARLYSSQEVTLAVVEFRKRSTLPESKAEQIKARVRTELEDYIDLTELLCSRGFDEPSAPVPAAAEMNSFDEVERYADDLRRTWDMGSDPIRNVIESIEEKGVTALTIDSDHRFDELACVANGRYQVVVTKNLEDGKGDRQRFNVLHGLGHLLLCPGAGMDKEKMCHRFAGAMLAPREVAVRKLGKSRRNLDLDYELQKLKQEFGMSIQAWISRARDLSVINAATATALFVEVSKRRWKKDEPVPIPLEAPSRFRLMVSRARAEGMISPAKAAEYLREQTRKTRPPLTPSGVPDSAVADYAPGGALRLWDKADTSGLADV